MLAQKFYLFHYALQSGVFSIGSWSQYSKLSSNISNYPWFRRIQMDYIHTKMNAPVFPGLWLVTCLRGGSNHTIDIAFYWEFYHQTLCHQSVCGITMLKSLKTSLSMLIVIVIVQGGSCCSRDEHSEKILSDWRLERSDDDYLHLSLFYKETKTMALTRLNRQCR